MCVLVTSKNFDKERQHSRTLGAMQSICVELTNCAGTDSNVPNSQSIVPVVSASGHENENFE